MSSNTGATKAKVVAFSILKGGTGKTTLAVNFAAIAARMLGNGQVLIIDADSQANCTVNLMGDAGEQIARSSRTGPGAIPGYTLMDVANGRCNATEAIYEIELPKVAAATPGQRAVPPTTLHVMPAHEEMAMMDAQLYSVSGARTFERYVINPVAERYQLIIIDCPPSVGGFMLNTLTVADFAVLPVPAGKYEIDSTVRFIGRVIGEAQGLNPRLTVGAIVPSKIRRRKMDEEAVTSLREAFGPLVLPEISDRQIIRDAQAAGLDVLSLAGPKNDSSMQLVNMTMTILTKVGLRTKGQKRMGVSTGSLVKS